MEKRILIIEDNEDDLFIMKRYLSQAGFKNIIDVGTVAEGLRMAVEEKPDLVISDTLLPDGDGFKACSEIKETLGEDSPKVIVTTGSVDAVDAIKARRVGADEYCAKAFDCSPLLEAVKKILV